ncbi:hypothetical protein [Sanguibacter sp. 25GB23B1]|uniref:hypothetical protein n=1 Tax=unclassified Sanguibacter TaxID=2645534 RepID=UPI0032AFD370
MPDSLDLARWITHPAWAAHATAERHAADTGTPEPLAPAGLPTLFHSLSVPTDAVAVTIDVRATLAHRVTVDGLPVPGPSMGTLDLTHHVRGGALHVVIELERHAPSTGAPAVRACVSVLHADGSREHHPTDQAWGARLTTPWGTSASAAVLPSPAGDTPARNGHRQAVLTR